MTRPRCRDCLGLLDPILADVGVHASDCTAPPEPLPLSIIRAYATEHDVFCINDCRSWFSAYGLKPSGSHFTAAINAGVIRKAGHTASDLASTNRAEVKTYESLITRQAMEERRAA